MWRPAAAMWRPAAPRGVGASVPEEVGGAARRQLASLCSARLCWRFTAFLFSCLCEDTMTQCIPHNASLHLNHPSTQNNLTL
ncbi:hypothetical protein EYF80_061233 [Liparis tanakae]|uniref:Uncharacterized protein n=1 Tax=Liparis tanakae TaxID=230148 RepID=A0A4Z2EIN7_9TELE|nr:hypothetical protein EYF80_061233 [Liparis tanakae]